MTKRSKPNLVGGDKVTITRHTPGVGAREFQCTVVDMLSVQFTAECSDGQIFYMFYDDSRNLPELAWVKGW